MKNCIVLRTHKELSNAVDVLVVDMVLLLIMLRTGFNCYMEIALSTDDICCFLRLAPNTKFLVVYNLSALALFSGMEPVVYSFSVVLCPVHQFAGLIIFNLNGASLLRSIIHMPCMHGG